MVAEVNFFTLFKFLHIFEWRKLLMLSERTDDIIVLQIRIERCMTHEHFASQFDAMGTTSSQWFLRFEDATLFLESAFTDAEDALDPFAGLISLENLLGQRWVPRVILAILHQRATSCVWVSVGQNDWFHRPGNGPTIIFFNGFVIRRLNILVHHHESFPFNLLLELLLELFRMDMRL